MLLERSGYPQEDEFVLVTVTKVNPNSVFCVLDHYGKKTGLIHISEISPGRIRNIREHVVEGKKIVVKILRVDLEKGHIDLSLRRVTEIQKRNFNDTIKREQKAEKLLDYFEKDQKIPPKDMKEIIAEIQEEYEFVYDFFSDIVENDLSASEVVKKKAIATKLEAFVRDKIQPEEVALKMKFSLTFFDSNGLEDLKEILLQEQDDHTNISYGGAGHYTMLITEKDFKLAQKRADKHLDVIEKYAHKKKGFFVVIEE